MELPEAIAFFEFLIEREQEDLLWQRWVAGYQDMSFAEFKAGMKPKPEIKEERIINDAANILGLLQERADPRGDI